MIKKLLDADLRWFAIAAFACFVLSLGIVIAATVLHWWFGDALAAVICGCGIGLAVLSWHE